MRNKEIKLFALFLILFFIASCDAYKSGDGVVFDADTQKPIDSVRIEAFLVSDQESVFVEQLFTDSVGFFDSGTGNLPASGAEADYLIILSKNGYENLVVKNPKDSKIYLKTNKTRRDYLETLYSH